MAEATDADLILLGTGEPPNHERFAIGPVAEAVVQHARQPVLAVRSDQAGLAFQRIFCPVDCSSVSQRALHNAVRLARGFGGRLIVATVIPSQFANTAAKETAGAFDAQLQEACAPALRSSLRGSTSGMWNMRWTSGAAYPIGRSSAQPRSTNAISLSWG